jgi:hypothetical protein
VNRKWGEFAVRGGELVVTKLKAMGGVASKRGKCTKGASKGETAGIGRGRRGR